MLSNTNLIRHRIESGEVKGPRILTVGEPFWIKTPVYVRDFLQTNHISIPEVESSTQAVERVRQQIRDGADGIKIFANSIEDEGILTRSYHAQHRALAPKTCRTFRNRRTWPSPPPSRSGTSNSKRNRAKV